MKKMTEYHYQKLASLKLLIELTTNLMLIRENDVFKGTLDVLGGKLSKELLPYDKEVMECFTEASRPHFIKVRDWLIKFHEENEIQLQYDDPAKE